MLRSLIALSLILGMSALSVGCSDSCDELCAEQSRFINDCLDVWALEWEDIVGPEYTATGERDADNNMIYDSQVIPYASAGDYRSRCKQSKDRNIALAVQACAGIDTSTPEGRAEQNRCEDTFRLDIIDTCEGDKINFRYSCQSYIEENLDPALQLGGGDDDSAMP